MAALLSEVEELDVVVVGAGLSGICAARYVQHECAGLRFALLESRDAIGGTWDLFRYPGVRSDSDMHTLAYAFRPWTCAVTLNAGVHRLRVRATSRSGETQPETAGWNPGGYLRNVVETTQIAARS